MNTIFRQAVTDLARGVRNVFRADSLRVWICLIAFVVSLGYALIYRIEPSVDARRYHLVATHLVTQGTFCETCDVPLAKDTAIHGVGPGYQFFLAGIYTVFGIRLWVVWVIQAFFFAMVLWWAWGLAARAIPPEKRGRWTFAIPFGVLAIHPDIVQNNAMLMTDGLFLFLLMASVRVGVSLWDRMQNARPKSFLAGSLGFLLGMLTLVRPTGLPLCVLVLCLLFWKRKFVLAVLVVLMFVVVQVPWNLRNLNVYDGFVYNSVVGGLDVWVGIYPGGRGEFDMDALPEIAQRIKGLDADEIEHLSLVESKKILQERPVFVIGRTIQKGLKLFALTKTSAFWFHYVGLWDRLATLVLSVICNIILLGMSFAAIWESIFRRRVHHWMAVLAIVVIAVMAISPTLTVVVNRYRIPMLPFMALLSAMWLAYSTGVMRRYSLLAAGATLAVTTGVDLWGSWDKVIERIQRFRS